MGILLVLLVQADDRPNILLALADDWAWPHAGVYGDKVVETPVFNSVAAEGVLFTHCFCAAPTCTASRSALLTGQAPHRLEESGNLWSTLQKRFPVYPDLLEAEGYLVGMTRKGWGPGNFKPGGRDRNPAGPEFKSFQEFFRNVPSGKPFCFWFGSRDPHRPYVRDSGVKSGMRPEEVQVPPYLPDSIEVRKDILDYYFAVQRFDREVGEILKVIEAAGRKHNTFVVITGDNGWPFPRGKATIYDAGTRQPLAVRWPAKIRPGRVLGELISFYDFAPTFLEAANLRPLAEMTGRSFLGLLMGKSELRDEIFVERERHANVRKGDLSYPSRGLRTKEWLLIRNFRPNLWPAGDPEKHVAVGPFGDIDPGPSKDYILEHRDRFFDLACGKRPAEELFDVRRDPWQLDNLAERAEFSGVHKTLRERLAQWMEDTGDPRVKGEDDRWDKYPYYGK